MKYYLIGVILSVSCVPVERLKSIARKFKKEAPKKELPQYEKKAPSHNSIVTTTPINDVIQLCYGHLENFDQTYLDIAAKKLENNDLLAGDDTDFQSCIYQYKDHIEGGNTKAVDALVFWFNNSNGENRKKIAPLIGRAVDKQTKYFFSSQSEFLSNHNCNFIKVIPVELREEQVENFFISRVENLANYRKELSYGQSKTWIDNCLRELKNIPGNPLTNPKEN